jgi:succinyl-CoA synthetase beta subunit
MDVHEFQAKATVKKYGVYVPPYAVASSLREVEIAIDEMGLNEAVVKVQVHAGGRGKAGGVKLAKNREEILHYAGQLLGMKIVNNQTGKEGIIAHQVLITPLIKYTKEYYVGIVIDRQKAIPMMIVSAEGGTEIEETAQKSRAALLKVPIALDGKIRGYHLFQLAKFLGWHKDLAEQSRQLFSGLAKAFIDCDASLLEINPLVETEEGLLAALDVKLSIDDNACYRQPAIAAFYDPSQLSKNEAKAKTQDLAYVALEGDIGCMVNGAGLAMATMDIIHHYGGKPANFLDVGGGASEEKISEGFRILVSDPNVKAILVNIFGGIMNCATLASGIVSAAATLHMRAPLIVRMEGTNVEQGKKILADSGLNISIAHSLEEAASSVVEAAKSFK